MHRAFNTVDFFNKLHSLIQGNLSLVQSLDILSMLREENTKSHTQLTAHAILESIKIGYTFSRSLLLCPYIDVSKGTAHLLEAAEHGACLKEAVKFVCEENEKQKQIHNEIVNALVYPLVVVIMAVVGTIALLYWKDLFLSAISTADILLILVRAFSVFIVLLLLLFAYIFSSLKFPPLFTFYYSLSFLQNAGFTFCKSLEIYMSIHYKHPLYKNVYDAYCEISKGNLVSVSLSKAHLANQEMTIMLEISEKTGNIVDVCKNISHSISRDYEVKKNHCVRLLEPLLLFVVGVYLAILMEGIFLPYITDFGGIL